MKSSIPMVTDVASNYTSPAGRECTLASGRFAGINPASQVLDMGCGYGEGACTIAKEFRCRVTAIDNNHDNIAAAQRLAVSRGVSHLISYICQDCCEADFANAPFDLVCAEGGVLSFLGRPKGLALAARWTADRGWFAFSDLILLSEQVPDEVLSIFQHSQYRYETEDSYRRLVAEAGFDIHFMSLVPPSGWHNYYANMAKRLEDETGFFADRRIKLAFHREIDVFYRLEGYKHVGYLYGISRKNVRRM